MFVNIFLVKTCCIVILHNDVQLKALWLLNNNNKYFLNQIHCNFHGNLTMNKCNYLSDSFCCKTYKC